MEAIVFLGKKDAKGMIKISKEIQAQFHGEFRVIIIQDCLVVAKKMARKK
jgi:hypothetical protein